MNQRRMMWWFSALLVAGVLLSVSTGAPPARGQIATPSAVTAAVPDWRFVVHGMQDPYLGVLTYAPEPAEGMRYVGFDIEVVNASDQPLTVGSNVVSLRMTRGSSIAAGTLPAANRSCSPSRCPGASGSAVGLVSSAGGRDAEPAPPRGLRPGTAARARPGRAHPGDADFHPHVHAGHHPLASADCYAPGDARSAPASH